MHDKNAARRVLAGHLTNLYAGVIDGATCDRNLRALSAYGAERGDVELEGMTRELANQLAEGLLPTLVLPEIGLTVEPDEGTAERLATVAEIADQAALVESAAAIVAQEEAEGPATSPEPASEPPPPAAAT